MKDEELFELSESLKVIRDLAVKLMSTDWYAYHHMVNNSEKGYDCGYAKILKRNGFKELSKLKTIVLEIDKKANLVKERINVCEEEK
jgi:hypothetical protein